MHERHTHSSRHKHRLWAVLALSTVFMVIQVVVGWWTGSLALLADAAHLFVDAAGVGLSLLAVWFAEMDWGSAHALLTSGRSIVGGLIGGLLAAESGKLLIDLGVESRAIRPVIGGADQIVRRSGGGIDGALRVVLRDVWIVAEEILDRRIPASLRNLIIGKGSPVPALASRGLAERIRAKSRRSRIVNLVQAAEIKIAREHLGGRHRKVRRLPALLMVTLESEQPEGLVLAVIDLRDVDRTARRGRDLMVGKGVDARKLLEPGAMDQLLLDIAILRRTVPPVGTRFEHGREEAARGVSELGRHTRGEELHLLERVDRGGGDLVGGPDHGAHRFLAADSIYRVPERPLALTDDVLAVDVRGGRQIQKNPERVLLQNRNLDDGFALQNLACRSRLGFQQGSRRGHLDRFRYGPDLQLHVDAGLLATFCSNAFRNCCWWRSRP